MLSHTQYSSKNIVAMFFFFLTRYNKNSDPVEMARSVTKMFGKLDAY